MKKLSALAIGLLATALAGGAMADDLVYTCTGPGPHQADINAALAAAGPGGSVTLEGECFTTAFVTMNLENQTLRGNCGAAINRTGGSCIQLRANASGSTIEGLTLRSAVGSGIINNGAAGAPLDQPDGITIRNNVMEVAVRCISQYSHNGAPFNDIDRATGDPVGISTGWVITRNHCETSSEIQPAILITGNDFEISYNYVKAPLAGIWGQNNVNATPASVQMFGSASGLANVHYLGNVIEVDSLPGTTFFYPTGGIELGYDFFTLIPEQPGNRSFGNVWDGNSITAKDSSGNFLFSVAIQVQLVSEWTGTNNDLVLPLNSTGVDGGNTALANSGGNTMYWGRNRSTGSGDFDYVGFGGQEFDNLFEKNKIGLGYSECAGPGFVALGSGPGPETFTGNQYCCGSLVGVVDAGDNQAGKFCKVEPPGKPARPRSARAPKLPCSAISAGTGQLMAGMPVGAVAPAGAPEAAAKGGFELPRTSSPVQAVRALEAVFEGEDLVAFEQLVERNGLRPLASGSSARSR